MYTKKAHLQHQHRFFIRFFDLQAGKMANKHYLCSTDVGSFSVSLQINSKNVMKKSGIIILLGLLALPLWAQQGEPEMKDPRGVSEKSWQSITSPRLGWGSTNERYGRGEIAPLSNKLSLHAWRGERVSAQAVLMCPQAENHVSFEISDLTSGKNRIAAENVRKYFVRYIMTDEFKNAAGEGGCGAREKSKMDSSLVADALDATPSMDVEAQTSRPLWLDIRVPQGAAPGKYTGKLTVNLGNLRLTLPLTLDVAKRTLPEPKDWTFHLDLWQNPFAVARYYNVPLWSKAHFDVMRPLMKQLADAGQKVITCSIIQHPWNSQTQDPFESMIAKMKTVDGNWKYDYTVFDRWVEFMMSVGITQQIDCYTIVPWKYTFDYFDLATNSVKYVACAPNTKEYEQFLLPFLTDFAAHLKAKGWFSRTCIAMDERPMDQLRAAYDILHRADPEFKVEGAANYYPEVEPKMYDLSVTYEHPLLDAKVLEARRAAGHKVTFYTCCGPERPNTFTFSPPAEATYMGWHAAAAGYDGYLRWAYNSWVSQPMQDSRFRTWSAGDCALTYPCGSSIRMERLVQGIQDFEKIQILKKTAKPAQMKKLNSVLAKFRPNDFMGTPSAAQMVKEGEQTLRELE
jgi:hypothetical protein